MSSFYFEMKKNHFEIVFFHFYLVHGRMRACDDVLLIAQFSERKVEGIHSPLYRLRFISIYEQTGFFLKNIF